ncbi:hypothetical protein AUJ46_01875 [Candidatus Peregrinibacteria bacterium CG1_02_54_53]|nr:MAG: hypothetical protein AUJ46_01875 [Candidatus Peregrinibacteria bacterium CG1_02_54_53]
MSFRSLLTFIGLTLILTGCATQTTMKPQAPEPEGSGLSLVDNHVHALAFDRMNADRLYLATHEGLLVLTPEGHLSQVSTEQHDFMGFSIHPFDPQRMFGSGHPESGGNLGFIQSSDGGRSWQKIADVTTDGPVDFHAMTVSQTNPNLLFGWEDRHIYRSEDGGVSWSIASRSPVNVLSLATDSEDDRILYIGTNAGLLKSADRGETWEHVNLVDEVPIFGLFSNRDGTLTLATSWDGLLQINLHDPDSRITRLSPLPDKLVAKTVTVDPGDSTIIIAAAEDHVFRSDDGGMSWQNFLPTGKAPQSNPEICSAGSNAGCGEVE